MAPPLFPHMAPGDIPLFCAFVLSEEGKVYQRWEFDVSVGPGVDPGQYTPEPMRSNAIYLTQLKIDAIGWAGQIPTIFEVKPNLTLQGFGQILAYASEYQKATGIQPMRAGITDHQNPQYAQIYLDHAIDVHIVAPASLAQQLEAKRRILEMNGGVIKPTRLISTGTIPLS